MSEANEMLILENQLTIMWALIVDMPDYEIRKDLEKSIFETETRLKQLKKK